MSEGKKHKALIAELVGRHSGAQTSGFASFIRGLVESFLFKGDEPADCEGKAACEDCAHEGPMSVEDVAGEIRRMRSWDAMRVRPDAFLVVGRAAGLGVDVFCYEVEVTSPIDELKMSRYIDLWHGLDWYAIELHLVAVNRLGIETEHNLSAWHLAESAA